MPVKLNNTFIEQKSGPSKRCHFCDRRYLWAKGRYQCPSCGATADSNEIIKRTKKVLQADISKPILMSMKGSKKRSKRSRADFPPHAHISRDIEQSPDGSQKDLIIDNRDA